MNFDYESIGFAFLFISLTFFFPLFLLILIIFFKQDDLELFIQLICFTLLFELGIILYFYFNFNLILCWIAVDIVGIIFLVKILNAVIN